MIISKNNKIILEVSEEKFIKDNFFNMKNQELADALGLKLTKFRQLAYKLGLKRMTLQYWTEEQVLFLKNNYKKIGDTELAIIFSNTWAKDKGWTLKHIEKKRRYLNLKRTPGQLKNIKKRNVKNGCWIYERWSEINQAKIGEKRIWFTKKGKPFIVIKTKKGFVHYNRWLYESKIGKIPPGKIVRIIGDPINYTEKDLILITRQQHAAINSKSRLPKELKQIQKYTNQLLKLTTNENRRQTKSAS